MTPERRRKIEAAGFAVEDSAEDALGLDAIDRKVVAFRLALAAEVRRLRAEKGMTQNELAARIEVSQSRITGIEAGAGVSLETLATAFIALGGDLVIGDIPDEVPVVPRAATKAETKAKAKAKAKPKRPAKVE